ncbi:MAG TPA: hypothetical protein VEK79_06870 [Thermoanaerobaculia bacterium]|nr:hypothetical protein [Thermoanaerobaculia bacterium]
MATTRRGLPNPKSVVMEIPFSPAGILSMAEISQVTPKYRIIRTNEVDGYETTPSKLEVAEALSPAAAKAKKKKKGKAGGGDNFKGTSRKASKLSISDAKLEKFADLADLLKTLVDDKVMAKKKISTEATSKRVAQEERNVRVDVWIYAASVEDDNDYHLILGRDPDAEGKAVYMTMELSGLPPANAKSRQALEKARTDFKKFFTKHFAGNLPGKSYDFYDPPIEVQIEGSLFFDANHATGSKPGPQSLRKDMPTVWEVHPISKIKLTAP